MLNSLKITTFTPEGIIKYQQDMTTERDIRNYIAFAWEEGFKEGFQRGYIEGYKQGYKEGREEARKLLAERLSACGYSEEKIESILDACELRYQPVDEKDLIIPSPSFLR